MFLGALPVDATFTVRVVWTPAAGSPSASDSAVTFVHAIDGDVIGPLDANADGANAWKVQTSLPKAGRWRVKWSTTPLGGFTDDVLYVQ